MSIKISFIYNFRLDLPHSLRLVKKEVVFLFTEIRSKVGIDFIVFYVNCTISEFIKDKLSNKPGDLHSLFFHQTSAFVTSLLISHEVLQVIINSCCQIRLGLKRTKIILKVVLVVTPHSIIEDLHQIFLVFSLIIINTGGSTLLAFLFGRHLIGSL